MLKRAKNHFLFPWISIILLCTTFLQSALAVTEIVTAKSKNLSPREQVLIYVQSETDLLSQNYYTVSKFDKREYHVVKLSHAEFAQKFGLAEIQRFVIPVPRESEMVSALESSLKNYGEGKEKYPYKTLTSNQSHFVSTALYLGNVIDDSGRKPKPYVKDKPAKLLKLATDLFLGLSTNFTSLGPDILASRWLHIPMDPEGTFHSNYSAVFELSRFAGDYTFYREDFFGVHETSSSRSFIYVNYIPLRTIDEVLNTIAHEGNRFGVKRDESDPVMYSKSNVVYIEWNRSQSQGMLFKIIVDAKNKSQPLKSESIGTMILEADGLKVCGREDLSWRREKSRCFSFKRDSR